MELLVGKSMGTVLGMKPMFRRINNKYSVMGLLVGTALTNISHADVLLSQEQIYYRCYGQLVRARPDSGDTRLAAVRAGTLTGPDACMQLLDLARIGADGLVTSRISGGAPDPIAARILQTMNDFHRTWFDVDYYPEHLPEIAMNSVDPAQPAYMISNALFGSSVNYSSIVTATTAIDPIRDGAPDGFQRGKPLRIGSWAQAPAPLVFTLQSGGVSGGSTYTQSIPFVPLGRLVGFSEAANVPIGASSVNIRWNLILNAGSPAYNFRGTHGGGIMGTLSYFMYNNGRPLNEFTDGGIHVHRRFAKQVYRNILCRELPVIRATDAAPYVQISSSLPFRSGVSCMRCHASMDTMAYAVRNMHFSWVNPNMAGQLHITARSIASARPAESGPVDEDDEFSLRPANGTLRFRSYDGTLVNTPVTGIQGLGEAIANTNDLYACAAKRYFRYFTGVDASLHDIGDPDAAMLNAKDTAYRNYVIQLATQLRTDQSLRNMLRTIFSSPYYRKAGYGVKE
jgi:hypothetical protein